MSREGVLRWWPPVGILLMVVLGVAVGDGSTRLDDWFIDAGESHRYFAALLFFTQPLLLRAMLAVAVVAAAYRRRWRLALVVLLTPAVAVVAVRVLKPVFGREKGGALAYPGGHVTVMVAVLGVVVLVAGARMLMLVAAAVFAFLGIVGQSLTYHYFTDTIGAAFLGTALVGLAVFAAGLDRCQPGCDLHHSGGLAWGHDRNARSGRHRYDLRSRHRRSRGNRAVDGPGRRPSDHRRIAAVTA